jgi:hypothetical protein
VPEAPTISATNSGSASAADKDLFCPQCGYSLRGLGEPGGAGNVRCPECGFAVNLQTLRQSIIPWVHRHEIGRWRAYWRTVRLVSRRPKLVAGEASKPLRIEDAIGFRRMTAFLVFLPLAALLVWGYVARIADPIRLTGFPLVESRADPQGARGGLLAGGHALGWVLEWAVVAAGVLGLWLLSLGVTGMASYFFHPPGLTAVQQNRAVALSYFACAALAYTPLSVGLMVVATAVVAAAPRHGYVAIRAQNLAAIATAIGLIMLSGQCVIWYADTLRMLRRATYGSTARVWTAAATLPAMALLLALLTLVVFPAVVALVGLVILGFA